MDPTIELSLEELTIDQLIAYETKLVTAFNERRATGPNNVEKVTDLAVIRGQVDTVRSEIKSRQDLEAQLAELTIETPVEAAVETPAETPAVEAAAAPAVEAAAIPVVEAPAEVVAAAVEVPELSPNGLTPPAGSEPFKPKSVAVIRAGADTPGITAGSDVLDLRQVAELFVKRQGTFRGASPSMDGQRVLIASITGEYPEEFHLRAGKDDENMTKINTVVAALESGVETFDSLVASGGICAPSTPYYGLQTLAVADRPVKAAFPNFNADRGAINWITPPKLSDLSSAVGIRTAAQDATGYPPTATKAALRISCGTPQSATIEAIYRHLIFGNFGARTFPEHVEAWLQLSIAEHARTAESHLLDKVQAASTKVTQAKTYSAARTLLPSIDQAAAGMRSRNRMRRTTPLRWIGPEWVYELLRADIARDLYPGAEAYRIPDSEITSWFANRNINATFHLDSATTGTSQIFGAQAAAALDKFPADVVYYLYPEGSFLLLDGGTLDLGIVRDSTLNTTNDYSVFAEVFETLAFVGLECMEVTATLFPDGSGPTGATIIT